MQVIMIEKVFFFILQISFIYCLNCFLNCVIIFFSIECLAIRNVHSTANALTHQKNLTHNGVEKCSLFCQHDGTLKNKDFILLQVFKLGFGFYLKHMCEIIS